MHAILRDLVTEHAPRRGRRSASSDLLQFFFDVADVEEKNAKKKRYSSRTCSPRAFFLSFSLSCVRSEGEVILSKEKRHFEEKKREQRPFFLIYKKGNRSLALFFFGLSLRIVKKQRGKKHFFFLEKQKKENLEFAFGSPR